MLAVEFDRYKRRNHERQEGLDRTMRLGLF